MKPTFEALLTRMQELRDLSGLSGLATWDQETYLPPKAEAARGAQLATLSGVIHERTVDPALGDLLEWAKTQSLAPGQRAMVELLDFDRSRSLRTPAALVKALAAAQSRGLGAWREARRERRFEPFRKALGELLRLRREQADALGHDGERYDALLQGYERGMTVARLTPVLDRLRAQLSPLVATLAERHAALPRPLEGRRFPQDAQYAFTFELLKAMRFDLEAGRQDLSIHPFTGGTHPTDVRLTTHVVEEDPLPAIFSTIHEGGHGLYEQGFHPDHHRTPVANAPSMGLHESQSRLWENFFGRSAAFWRFFYPKLVAQMPESFAGVSERDFVTEVNRVERGRIRIEADEVSYNLHICLRYELELLLLRDALPLDALPDAWNDRMEKLLGVRPRHDGEGVLQDIHWAWGELGYFPTYALGNLYAASVHRTLQQALDLDGLLSRGELNPVREWLRTNIHEQGSLYPAEVLMERVTSHGLRDDDFLAYVRAKYEVA